MPPEPIGGIFNARFQSGRFIETIPPTNAVTSIPVLLRNPTYPVRLQWNIGRENNAKYWLSMPNQKKLALTASGSTQVQSAASGALLLIAQATQPCPPATRADRGDEVNESMPMPSQYSLAQNYPNPFNPPTQIRYDLPEPTHVRLAVFNVLGQEVQVLLDEAEDAGYKTANFDASKWPSGVYFYRLQAGNFTAVKKMILAK